MGIDNLLTVLRLWRKSSQKALGVFCATCVSSQVPLQSPTQPRTSLKLP